MNLSARVDLAERMDSEDLDPVIYRRCLSDLAALNKVTFTHRPTLQFLRKATRNLDRGARFSVLDVASGHGDLLRAIHRWAMQKGFEVTLVGVDMNPRSAEVAREATLPEEKINFITSDVFAYAPVEQPDYIVTSQFTHHLPDLDILKLLGWLEDTARCGWHVTDLHRHIFPYYGFRTMCRIFGWHSIVRLDGTASIARSFRRDDWAGYLEAAGIDAEISWRFPFRFGICRIK
jgi:SAM-dependent methyltransferase